MSDARPTPQPARRSRLRTLLRYAVIAFVVVVAGLFFARREIGSLLARRLNERLAAAGVYVEWRSANWLPGHGVQFRDLALFRDEAKHDRLALLTNVNVIKGETEWNRWDTVSVKVDDARLTLGSGEDETKLEHLDMQLSIQPGKTDLQQCHASLQGLRIEAKGSHLRATATTPAPENTTAKPAKQKRGLFDDVQLSWLKPLKEWIKFQPEKDEPVLKVEFNSRPDGGGMDLAATLDGKRFQWRGQKWDLIEATVKTTVGDKNSAIEIDQVRIGHAEQVGEFAGAFDPARNVLRISKLDSGIDVLALARAFVPEAVAGLATVTTTGESHITGEGEISLNHPESSRWNGHVVLNGDLGWQKSGKDPVTFQPGKGEPLLKVEFHLFSDAGGLNLSAMLNSKKLQCRGQQWDFIEVAMRTKIGAKNSPVEIDHARMGYAGQTGELAGAFDPVSGVLHISRLDSGIDVLAIARAFVPEAVAGLATANTTGGWRLSGEGEIPLSHPESSRWNGHVVLNDDLVYAAGETRVALQKPAFGLSVEEQLVTVSDFKAGLWNGNLDVPMARVHLSSEKKKPRFEVQLVLDQAQLESVLNSFGPPQKQPGTVRFDWKGGGELDLASFTGVSTLSIHDAKIFSIPQQDHLAFLGNVTVTKGDAAGKRGDVVNVRVADAQLTLGTGEDETKLEDLNMQLRSEPGSAELQEFRASLSGLRIEAKGTRVQTVAAVHAKVEVAHDKTDAAHASANVATKPASQDRALFDFNLDWLKPVKEWTTMIPEKDAPVLKMEFHPRPNGAGLNLAATLQGRNFSWRGQRWDSVDASVKTSVGKKKSPVQIGQIRLGQAGRTAELEGEYDQAGKVVRIGRIEIGIDLLTVVRTLAPGLTPSLTAITSPGACRINGKAEIPVDGSGKGHWYGRVELDGDLVYASKPVRVAVQNPACEVDLLGSELSFASLKGQLWNGSLEMPTLQIHLPSGKKKARFEMQIELQQAQLESVLGSFGPPQKQPGTIQCDWKGGGAFDLAAFAGVGTLSIKDAEFLHLPLVGGLNLVLDKLTPGFGRDTSTRATTTHRTEGGILHLENMVLDSEQVHIDLGGTIDLKRQYVDIAGEARMKAVLGLVTSPLRTRTAIKGEGPLGEVQWDHSKKPGSGLIGRTLKAIGGDDGDNNEGAAKAAKNQPKNPGKPQSDR